MEERREEIGTIVDLISKICKEAEIGLIAKEVKGKIALVAADARNGKEYVIINNSNKD